MYKCLDCDCIFEEPKKCHEDFSPNCYFEGGTFIIELWVCPKCEGMDYKEMIECSQCGELTIDGNFYTGHYLCNECAEELSHENSEQEDICCRMIKSTFSAKIKP